MVHSEGMSAQRNNLLTWRDDWLSLYFSDISPLDFYYSHGKAEKDEKICCCEEGLVYQGHKNVSTDLNIKEKVFMVYSYIFHAS